MPPYTLLIKRQTPRGYARLLDRYTDPLTALHWARINYEGNPSGIISFELHYLGLLVADTTQRY